MTTTTMTTTMTTTAKPTNSTKPTAAAKTTRPVGEEEALMEKYIRGDRQAFESLFEILAPRLHGFFLRKCGNPAMADDLLQSTFLKVHRARKTYRIGAPVRPWLFTIAARVRLDELRRRGRRHEETNPESFERASNDAGVAQTVSQADVIARKDVAAQVREALSSLPDSQRTVVQLHRYEELTFDEIARRLGSTEGAIKLRAFRAYEKLRVCLAPLLAA